MADCTVRPRGQHGLNQIEAGKEARIEKVFAKGRRAFLGTPWISSHGVSTRVQWSVDSKGRKTGGLPQTNLRVETSTYTP